MLFVNSLLYKELTTQLFLPRADSPYSPRLPASGFRAVFFAKPASMPVYPAEPFGSYGPQKSFESAITDNVLNFTSKIKKGCHETTLYSPARIRTTDPVVNSHLLCQLSYRGMCTLHNIAFCEKVVNRATVTVVRLLNEGGGGGKGIALGGEGLVKVGEEGG